MPLEAVKQDFTTSAPSLSELKALADRWDVPMEAVLKSDLLRLGVFFTDEALKVCSSFKEKSYFIFSFDMVPQKELSGVQKFSAPEEIALTGGEFNLLRTIVSVRLNPESPYTVDFQNHQLQLFLERNFIAEVSLNERPNYYRESLQSGKPVSDIAPTIEWGYLIYLTAFRLCQYWGEKEECQFCDINENYRQQVRERSYTPIKSIDEIIEALSIINSLDAEQNAKAYTVTGGAITKELEGLTEGAFYARYAEAIEKHFPGRWIGKAVVQSLPKDEVQMLYDAGYKIYHPNYEIWDKQLFNIISPGKARYVGRDEWIKRIVDAADIFGASNVIPNFVAGIEMAAPHGFKTVCDAISSTQEGLEFFMSKGILPRFTVWCLEPNTALRKTNSAPPPLEYYVQLLHVFQAIHKKYNLPIPTGYGPAGVGKALFSVSAFMDVLGN